MGDEKAAVLHQLTRITKLDVSLLLELLENPLYFPVIKNFLEQQQKGKEKYDTLLTLDKWNVIEYIEHLQQELTDGNVYLEGVKQHLNKQLEGWDLNEEYQLLQKRYREALKVIDRLTKENHRLKNQ